MRWTKCVRFAAIVATATSLAGSAFAASLNDEFSDCVEKFANDRQSASVILECTARGGKLSNCKVTVGPSPANGFDKAALCVANLLPIGSRTGTVKVPIRFQGAS